jgi:hypothetical protein
LWFLFPFLFLLELEAFLLAQFLFLCLFLLQFQPVLAVLAVFLFLIRILLGPDVFLCGCGSSPCTL